MKLAQKSAIEYVKARLHILALVSKKEAAKKALSLFSTPITKKQVKTPPIFSKSEKLSFQLDGLTIRGNRWLPKKMPSKKILICHGFESNTKKFSGYIPACIKKGYEVVVFDAPAHGESGGKKITLPLYARMIKEANKRFGPFHSFMAHSFGGLAVAHFLEDSDHSEETKLVLIAPATETRTAIDHLFKALELDNEVRTEFDQLILESTGKPQDFFSIRRAMNNINATILWVHDEEDEVTPISDVMNVKKNHHPNIEFIFTKGLGHRKIYRDEEVMKRITEFL